MAKKKPTAKQLAARKKFAAIMKSGGFKKKKSKSVKKSTSKTTKTVRKVRKRLTTKSNTRKPMARRKSFRRVSRAGKKAGMSLRRGIIGEVIKGVGGGTVVSLVMSRIAPQYAGIGSIAGGFLAGGIVGGAANLVVSGGLGNITTMLNPAQTTSAGVMSV